MMTELNKLVNAEIVVDGLSVTAITVRELPAFMAAIEPIIADIAAGNSVSDMMLSNVEAVINAVVIGLRTERAVVDAMSLDTLVDAAFAVFEVNADFFARRVMPKITQASERMAQALAGLNSTQGSEAQD